MPTISDDFAGPLGAGWDASGGDAVVAAGVLTCATGGGTGQFAIARTDSMAGAAGSASLVVNAGAGGVQVTLALGSGVGAFIAASYFSEFDLFVVQAGGAGTQSVTAAVAPAGQYRLELTVAGATVTGALIDTSDESTVATTTATLDGPGVALLAGGASPVIAGAASDDSSYDDFTATVDGAVAAPPRPGPLRFLTTDLEGTPGLALTECYGGRVVIPLSDSRTGSVEVSMDDPASASLTVGDTAVQVTYGSSLVLNAIASRVKDDFPAGRVVLTLHDPTIRAKHRHLRYGHASVTASLGSEPGLPVDGDGFRTILSDMGGGGSIPHTHIAEGRDETPTAELHTRVSRGQQAWDALTAMTEAAAGFDVDWHPVSALHPGAQEWEPGIMCEAVTVPTQGADRRQGNTAGNAPVVFVHGDGCAVVAEPDMERVVNYDVEVIPGGEQSPSDIGAKAGAYNHASWVQYGIYEAWESAGEDLAGDVRLDVLRSRALAKVRAYGLPSVDVTITVDDEGPGAYRYLRDFQVGDLVTVVARKGHRSFIGDVRITQVTLSQNEKTGGVSLELLCVPYSDVEAEILFDDDGDGDS